MIGELAERHDKAGDLAMFSIALSEPEFGCGTRLIAGVGSSTMLWMACGSHAIIIRIAPYKVARNES